MGLDVVVFGALPPDAGPVKSLFELAAGTDLFENVLGRVFPLRGPWAAVADEVVDKDVCVASDLAKVDGSSAGGEKEKPVEPLKELNGMSAV